MNEAKISLYVTEGSLTEDVVRQLENELIEATKIKDETIRAHVVFAISKLLIIMTEQTIKFYKGKVFFTNGYAIWTYPYHGKHRGYWFGDKFKLELLLADIKEQIGYY